MVITSELEERIRAVAGSVCRDHSLREDFAQEMRLALVKLPEGHRRAWYLARCLRWLGN